MTHYFPTHAPDDMRAAYLDLLKRSLMGWPYAKLGYKVTENERLEGKDWPDDAMTLLSLSRLNNIQECMETCLRENIPGHFMECGVWRGGACILMAGILHAWGVKDREVHLADSFMGVPQSMNDRDQQQTFHKYDYLSCSEWNVKINFQRYGLLSENVKSTQGFFATRLRHFSRPLAVLRIDGDLYSSTIDCLKNLYKHVVPGGYVIIDDYVNFPHVKAAVDEFREANCISEEIAGVDWSAVYWRKNAA